MKSCYSHYENVSLVLEETLLCRFWLYFNSQNSLRQPYIIENSDPVLDHNTGVHTGVFSQSIFVHAVIEQDLVDGHSPRERGWDYFPALRSNVGY